MNTPTEIIDKIKKLLRLSQSPNRHEAELAVQRAFEIASRHQIDIENISLEDDQRKIVSEKFPHGSRTSYARKKILNILVAFFNVNIVINTVSPWMRRRNLARPGVTFIGKPVDIQIARHVYDFLHTACASALKEFCLHGIDQGPFGYRKKRRKPAHSTQQNFVQGFIYGIASKLREARGELTEQQNGIVLHESARRNQFEETLFDPKKLTQVTTDLARRNRDAITAGYIEGQKVQIRKPLETSAAGQLLLSTPNP